MAVLTAAKLRPSRLLDGDLAPYRLPLAGYTNFGAGNTAHTVWKGSVVICDVSDTDGYFRAAPAAGSAAGDIFGGIALETVPVTSNDLADGAKYVSVASNGLWGFAKGSLAQTDIGAPAYASDDDTITTTSTNNYWVGYIVEVDATYVWVAIKPAFLMLNAAT